MSKFKAGDKVRILHGWYAGNDSDCRNSKDVGRAGVIIEVAVTNDNCRIKVDKSAYSEEWWYRPEDIELVKKPKTELRIVYKVVEIVAGDYVSYSMTDDRQCQYELEKKTKPPKGGNPLLAFDTYSNAIRFCGISGGWDHIFRCVAKVHKNPDFSFLQDVPDIPDGSVLCDWVFPVEQIK